jgi:hypothetical protein
MENLEIMCLPFLFELRINRNLLDRVRLAFQVSDDQYTQKKTINNFSVIQMLDISGEGRYAISDDFASFRDALIASGSYVFIRGAVYVAGEKFDVEVVENNACVGGNPVFILIPHSIRLIHSHIVSECWILELIVFEAHSRVNSIASAAFEDSSLLFLHVPKDVQVLENETFRNPRVRYLPAGFESAQYRHWLLPQFASHQHNYPARCRSHEPPLLRFLPMAIVPHD